MINDKTNIIKISMNPFKIWRLYLEKILNHYPNANIYLKGGSVILIKLIQLNDQFK
jgi:hypothetical protein